MEPRVTRSPGLVILWGLSLSSLHASILLVSTANDSGPGSLRQAIDTASSGDHISLAITGAISLTSGELVIRKDVTIAGPGANRLAVDANNVSRVFSVRAGASVGISGMTICGGHAFNGGGYLVGPGVSYPPGQSGGGIYNAGQLTLASCTICSNSAGDGGYYWVITPHGLVPGLPGSGGSGGGIYNEGSLSATGCSLYENSAGAGNDGVFSYYNGFYLPPGGDGGSGGAICNLGTVSLTNCTITANVAGPGGTGGCSGEPVSRPYPGLGGDGGSGGGIYNFGNVLLVGCTLGTNSAGRGGLGGCGDRREQGSDGGGGSIYNNSSAQLFDTLVASDLSGVFTSLGWNLIVQADPGSGFTNGTNSDLVGLPGAPLDPLLGPLQNNGGTTPTMALLPGSPAIDKGKNTSGLDTDQRGACFSRVCDEPIIANSTGGDGTDIGAFEVQQAGCSAANRITALIALLPTMNLPAGVAKNLSARLHLAAAALAKGKTHAACANLSAFLREVEGHKREKLSTSQAEFLQVEVACISVASGCPASIRSPPSPQSRTAAVPSTPDATQRRFREPAVRIQ